MKWMASARISPNFLFPRISEYAWNPPESVIIGPLKPVKRFSPPADLTTDAPEGVFSSAFIKNLFAQTLNADFARLRMELRVGTAADYILIDGHNYLIRSSNYNAPNKTGWLIDNLGNAYFNNGTFYGSLSGSISDGKHLNLHDNHRILTPQTGAELFNALVNIGIKPGEAEYNNTLCSGFLGVNNNGDVTYYFPQYLRTSPLYPNEIQLHCLVFSGSGLRPSPAFSVWSSSAMRFRDIELLVF
jgi:hypothetical protein